MWVANAGDGTVTQLNARDGAIERTIDLHAPVHGIAYGGGSLWVTDPVGNAVIRVPVSSPSSITRIDVGSGPSAIAYGVGTLRRLGYRVFDHALPRPTRSISQTLFGDATARRRGRRWAGSRTSLRRRTSSVGSTARPRRRTCAARRIACKRGTRGRGGESEWVERPLESKLDRTVTDSAVVIPFLNLKAIDFVSKRVGTYQHHPTFDLLIDQLWVQ